ncbi:hypothetical protein ACIP8Z_17735 [Streptomyces sp. NPDC088553]|uniref:hypothetical protein n=1 Tax=Streptomyces sp. NPDC088553 TaxID=3365864 RepID=UPI0038006945
MTTRSTDTDTGTGTDTGTDTGTGTGTHARSTLNLRLTAGAGLALLLACLVFTFMITLGDAIEGDGSSGIFITAGFWALALGAAAGVAALIVPRRGLVVAQYCLAFAGPFLALMD